MDAAANETSPKKNQQNHNGIDLDASQKSRLTLTTSSSNGSSSNGGPKKKFMLDNDDLYYEGNRIYKDDLDSDKGSSMNGSVRQKQNKIVKLSSEYDGLTIERKPNNVSFLRKRYLTNE